jgi:phospholipase C
MTMKRRDALKTLGGLAGMAGMSKLLPACGGGGEDGPVGITTFVYLMMENRSYDHYLGARALEGLGGDGLTAGMSNPDINGTAIAPFAAGDDHNQAASAVCDIDPPHGWDASHLQFAAGAMTGFVTEHQRAHGNLATAIEPMKFMERVNIPATWALADAYTTCDRWFCSVMGPTLPNRAYWHCGTSTGLDNNNAVLETFGNGVPVPTIYNRLEDAGIDWAYYFGSLSVVSLLANAGPFQIDLGPADGTGRIRRFGDGKLANGQFFKDAAAGKLPTVTYIDPGYGFNDDHPPVHPILGQELIAAVYTALARSPQWKNCLLVVTYDENGGYFDHVPPPTTTDDTMEKFGIPGFEQLGFRVPALVAGPYVKQNYVSSVQYDHTSALKHLSNHFGFEPLTARQAAANDLTDCIDLERLERGEPAAPITLPVFDSDEWPFDAETCVGEGGFLTGPNGPIANDPISEWANANPDKFPVGTADIREDRVEYLRSIRDYLRNNRL